MRSEPLARLAGAAGAVTLREGQAGQHDEVHDAQTKPRDARVQMKLGRWVGAHGDDAQDGEDNGRHGEC